jgi:signal transduction histidine kinase
MEPDPAATILLLEDDSGTARLEQLRLERAGYKAVIATSAAEGFGKISQGGIELIVLDQRLDLGASGLEFYRQVIAAGYNVPAILVTGMEEGNLLLEALRSGVRDFVPKTDNFLDHLEPIVSRVLDQVRTEHELAESRIVAREQEARRLELEREIAQRRRVEQALRDAEEHLRLMVDELEAERQALEEADRRKDQFLAMLAHELRNPLAPISNAVQLMRVEGPNGPSFAWSIEVIENQVRHMTRMVDDLLDVSRITRGKVVLQKELVKLADVVDLAVEASRPLIKDYGHHLTITLPDQPVVLEVDPARLAQVLANLLNNAAKYTDRGGVLALTAMLHAQEVEIRVRDNGIGISSDLLPRVFDLFTQADQSLSRSRGGLGIGLTLVRSLVEMHHGRVSASSAGLEQGSEFVVHVPLPASPLARDLGGEEAVNRQAPELLRRQILVVDDDRGNATSLAMLLRALGQEVYMACDGLTALELARRHRPALALVDIGLPGMDGYELARHCRMEQDLQQITLVAVTGYGKEEDKHRSQRAGFDAHLVKPVNLDDLRRLLSQAELFAHKTYRRD